MLEQYLPLAQVLAVKFVSRPRILVGGILTRGLSSPPRVQPFPVSLSLGEARLDSEPQARVLQRD